jgi:hypothetical protein
LPGEDHALDVERAALGGAEEEREAGDRGLRRDELVLADRGGEELVEGSSSMNTAGRPNSVGDR